MKKKFFLSIILLVFCCLLGAEFFLRIRYGMCDAVLMRADDDYEYIAQPNQERRRFGNRIRYNEFSMRSGPVQKDALKILCVGDSILNGGTLTDHDSLATTILSRELSMKIGKTIQVLNISAGSWGPDNCAAYLQRHGIFHGKLLILVTSSHDAFDTMTFVPVVGVTKYFPTRQYPLAIIELLDRYLYADNKIYRLTKDEMDANFRKRHHISRNDGKFNPGFGQLQKIALQNKIPFIIYLHAEQSELASGRYNPQGQLIIRFARENQIPLICDLDHGLEKTWFRDPIHYSAYGQQEMAKLLFEFIAGYFKRGNFKSIGKTGEKRIRFER